MRIRTVKPEFWTHRMHRVISEGEALLALAMLNVADDEGRGETAELALMFAQRPLSVPIPDGLKKLARAGWASIYRARIDGEEVELFQVNNFLRHQRVSKPKASQLPRRNGTLPPASADDSGTLPGTLPPASADDSDEDESSERGHVAHLKEGTKEEEGRKEGVPTLEMLLTYGSQRGMADGCCEKFFYKNNRRPGPNWTSELEAFWVTWQQVEEKTRNPKSEIRKEMPGDEEHWWRDSVRSLENEALGLAQSGEMEKARRLNQVIGERSFRTGTGR